MQYMIKRAYKGVLLSALLVITIAPIKANFSLGNTFKTAGTTLALLQGGCENLGYLYHEFTALTEEGPARVQWMQRVNEGGIKYALRLVDKMRSIAYRCLFTCHYGGKLKKHIFGEPVQRHQFARANEYPVQEIRALYATEDRLYAASNSRERKHIIFPWHPDRINNLGEPNNNAKQERYGQYFRYLNSIRERLNAAQR